MIGITITLAAKTVSFGLFTMFYGVSCLEIISPTNIRAHSNNFVSLDFHLLILCALGFYF